ncbi:MAG TPA: c-type cytochrome [Gemmatimonadales bacterium]|jgi:mono/diheme cytochrome c family protein|nr:c-type cytochrome [Gemmatimonadales bacterium]
MWRTNVAILAVTVGVIGFYTMIAHLIPQLQSEVPAAVSLGAGASAEELVAAGEQIYNQVCTACHGLGTRAPNLLTDHAGRGPIGERCLAALGEGCKDYLHRSLLSPGDSVLSGFQNIMPVMTTQLGGDQIWAVVAFLQSQGGEVTVTSSDLQSVSAAGAAGAAAAAGGPAAGSVAGGTLDPRQLLTQNACLGCHAIDGAGPPIGPSFDGMGGRLTAERIRRGILFPNADTAQGFAQFAGMMPQTFGTQLSAAQLEAIVQFLAARK